MLSLPYSPASRTMISPFASVLASAPANVRQGAVVARGGDESLGEGLRRGGAKDRGGENEREPERGAA